MPSKECVYSRCMGWGFFSILSSESSRIICYVRCFSGVPCTSIYDFAM